MTPEVGVAFRMDGHLAHYLKRLKRIREPTEGRKNGGWRGDDGAVRCRNQNTACTPKGAVIGSKNQSDTLFEK